jgi:hypothetical protein
LDLAKEGGPPLFGGLPPSKIDSFVAMSRENTSVEEVELYPFDGDAGNYEFWDRVGQIVGNFKELRKININVCPINESTWTTPPVALIGRYSLTRILQSLRPKVMLCTDEDEYGEDYGEEIQDLARVIHVHPMISECRVKVVLTFTNLGVCSALATLPSLKRGTFLREPETEDQRALVNPEPLMELLRAPVLCDSSHSRNFLPPMHYVMQWLMH